MQKTLNYLSRHFTQFQFVAGDSFYWSPQTKEIFYSQNRSDKEGVWSLLHETGHALLGHETYLADFELLKMEMAAWVKARQLASNLRLNIDEDHIQDCLDTYRDWLYKRSICPTCSTKALQEKDYAHYRCFNCHSTWRVTPSRFARAYRSMESSTTPLGLIFQSSLPR